MLLNETVDPANVASSFRYIPSEEIDFMASRMSIITQHYKNLGFSDIYFAMIPNPASIIDFNRLGYNHKIERIENTGYWFNMKFIDVYTIFKKNKKQIYRRDDSHWNNYGVRLWVDEVNRKLLSY